MMYSKDTMTFETTGREFYANHGIIGLSAEDGTVYEGYDGHLWETPADLDGPSFLTAQEVMELRDFMIATWTKWAADRLARG